MGFFSAGPTKKKCFWPGSVNWIKSPTEIVPDSKDLEILSEMIDEMIWMIDDGMILKDDDDDDDDDADEEEEEDKSDDGDEGDHYTTYIS